MSNHAIYPAFSYIENITNSQYAVATFTEDCDFTPGEYVSFRVTKPFGMIEINNVRGKVLIVNGNEIVVDIDTLNFTPFTLAALNTLGTTPPVCVPSASGVIPGSYPETVNLEDSFDNRRV